MSSATTIHLDEPVSYKGGKYDALSLKEFTAGQWALAEAKAAPTATFIQLITSVSGWPEDAVGELPWTKFEDACDFFSSLLGREFKDPRTSIELDQPIEFEGRTYEVLTLREFKASEKSKAETHGSPTLQYIQLLSFVSDCPVPVIRRLPFTVYKEAITFLEGFMRRGPAIGES